MSRDRNMARIGLYLVLLPLVCVAVWAFVAWWFR